MRHKTAIGHDMRLGIDLDNTIISYDRLFVQLASERQLVPPDLPPNKQAIRDYLRAQNQEDHWTQLQGIAYGQRIGDAVMFPGVQDFFRRCEVAGVEWQIISHRSQVPYLGEPTDLHAAALQWLVKQNIMNSDQRHRVTLETTRDGKLSAIAKSGCNVFIDDLPELLTDPGFPLPVRKILFDPADQNPDSLRYERATSWSQIATMLGV